MNQDPTSRVAPQVLAHLHLVADCAYPVVQQAHQQFILDELQKAPRVADNTAFSWQFLDAPQDGTVLLVYQPPHKANTWASDGYTWVTEQYYRQTYGPFIVEMYIAVNGYNPALEPRAGPAVHCRQRYRMVSDPNNPTKQGNPSLWLVQYKRSERMEQANRIPVTPQEAQIISNRNFLKSLGQLQEKKFMLADAPNWPAVTLPEAAQHHGALTFVGGQMANRMHMHMQQQQAYAREHGPSPKRARHGTNASQRSAPPQPPVTQAEIDEEDVAESDRRDVFDILTQRDISMMRFKNHEEWMEEIYSGYSTFDIKPVDLGFDRAGFMQPITDGFFTKPDRLPTPPHETAKQTLEHYGNITAKPFEHGKTKEFAKAVEKRIADNNAQIAEMKRIHEERIKNLNKGPVLREAATRIRGEQQNSRQKAKAAEESPSGEPKVPAAGPAADDESIEEITRQIEALVGKKIATRYDIKLVEKGGLVEETASKAKANGGLGDQGASLFDDFLDVGNSAETSNKPSASPQPPPGAQNEQPRDNQGDEWVMVQKQDAQSVQQNAMQTDRPDHSLGGLDGSVNDMVDFDDAPDNDNDNDEDDDDNQDGGAFDDAMHFDTMDTAGEPTPGFDADDLDGGIIDEPPPMPSVQDQTLPPKPAQNAHVPSTGANVPVTTEAAIASAHDTPDMAMDLMDDSAFGDAFHHTEAEAEDRGGLQD